MPTVSASILPFMRRERRRDRSRALRLVGIALAGSLGLHALLVGVLATMTSVGDAGRSDPFASAPIVATLSSPAVKFAVPSAEPVDPRRTELAPPSSVGEPAALPVPLRRSPPPPTAAGTPEGVATMHIDETTALDPALEGMLRAMHPDAVRAVPEFVVAAQPVYPMQALAQRRQHEQTVVVIVDPNGAVAPLDGTLADTAFDASIRAALAKARAQPATVDGQPRASWALARFVYEFVGVRN